MADRGRKAFPVSSHLCDERWQRHCMDLHKQRLSDMKHRIDNTKPETFDLVLSKGKRQMLDKERQTEVDRENAILLQKMVRIKEQDTRAVFRPWTARSTFQWKVGHYYDPATNTKTLDHINLTSSVSPRSIHYFALTRPGTAPPDVTARLRDMEIQVDNTKLLRAITTMRTHYSNEVFERRHAEESILVSRISNFRGPDSARYQPPGRSISASRNSPYLAPLPGRSSSSNRGIRSPRTGWPAGSPPVSQAQYYEEAQNRDIPPPSSRGNSRPGTAVGGTQEGLGATSPRESSSSRQSASSRQSSLSRHSGGALNGVDAPQAQTSVGGSRPGSGQGSRPGSAAIAGTSFSFAGKDKEQRKASGDSDGKKWSSSSSSSSSSSKSSTGRAAAEADPGTSAEDDYEDDQYEQDDQQRKEEDDAEPSPNFRRDWWDEESGSNDKDSAADDNAATADKGDGYTEPTPRGDGEEDAGTSRGDDEQPTSAAGAEEEAESKKYDAEEEAEAFEPAEAELRAELKEAEEAEMEQQFAEEMAADTYDDYGIGGGNTDSVGAGSYNTGASPKVGGFAEDWD
ncbi:hypothetical protein Vafri_19640 [Volvox africanus]|uniref:Uncharacterized protein n=1 Tax=Volvox africanus TaxID=51714 RepID=A0A8J4FCD1_9CHLO|nr:hypothetical protein Vafri_19640 [Volvox africanus]